MPRSQDELKAALKRIPLKRVYQALNKRYFDGRMPRAEIRWKPSLPGRVWGCCWADPRGVYLRGRKGQYRFVANVLIELSLSRVATYPRALVPLLAHEMIHGYLEGTAYGCKGARHGEEFKLQMARLQAAGCRVSRYVQLPKRNA